MLRFSKEPWTVRETRKGKIPQVIAGKKPWQAMICLVCEVFMDRHERMANAHLIAAAPDLLKAIIELLPYAEDAEDQGPAGMGWKSDNLKAVICSAQKAIEKATIF